MAKLLERNNIKLMKLLVKDLKAWFPGCSDTEIFDFKQAQLEQHNLSTFPKLDWVPAIQRRRLSPYSKIALSCAYDVSLGCQGALPCIFSSRHGDLHKTSYLLSDIALGNELSPTAFGLSVHNAVSGLFSIFTKNPSAMNAIVAGQDSFGMGLVEAYCRLTSEKINQVLFVHVDQALPEPYGCYEDEVQLDHAIAMILSLNLGNTIEFKCLHNEIKRSENELPLSLSYLQFYQSNQTQIEVQTERYKWNFLRAHD